MSIEKEAVRTRLLQRRRELLTRYRDELERVEEELATPQPEDVERAAEQWDAKVLASLGDTDLRAITGVMEALARLDAGTYGRCRDCAEPISEPRLAALPEAVTCIDCASGAFARSA